MPILLVLHVMPILLRILWFVISAPIKFVKIVSKKIDETSNQMLLINENY